MFTFTPQGSVASSKLAFLIEKKKYANCSNFFKMGMIKNKEFFNLNRNSNRFTIA